MLKIVCGAGNEDCESVKRLVYVYAKAGCKYFDISARKEILEAAKEAVSLAGLEDAHFCVSVGIKGDKHITKAKMMRYFRQLWLMINAALDAALAQKNALQVQ